MTTKQAEREENSESSLEEFPPIFAQYLSARSGDMMPDSVEAYEYNLSKFSGWLQRHGLQPESVTLRDLEMWRNTLSGGSAYKNQQIYTIRSFYKWMEKHGHFSTSPAVHLTPFSESPKDKMIPSIEDVKKCFQEFSQPYKLLVMIHTMTGARMEGAMCLRLSDIHEETQHIVLREKARKGSREKQERRIKIPKALLHEINAYMLIRPEPEEGQEDFLILNRKGKNYYTRSGKRQYQRYLERETIRVTGKQFTSHMFRKFYGTNLYQNNTDILLVSKLLGHKNITTTQVYLGVDQENLDRAVEQGLTFYKEEQDREEFKELKSRNEIMKETLQKAKDTLRSVYNEAIGKINEELEALDQLPKK